MRKKLDKSLSDAEASKKIVDLLRPSRKELGGEGMRYLIGREDGKVILAIVNADENVLHSFTLDWDTAAFIGYCLVSESIKTAGKDVAEYIMDLAKRRHEITAALALSATVLRELKDDKPDEFHGEGVA
jgi:hypothetical protein